MRILTYLWPRRWWQWSILGFIALLLVLIVSLPWFLREMIATQLAQATTARVQVADVDLNLFRQSLTVHDVALTLPEEEQPVIAIQQIRGALQLSALLLRREVVIEEIRLDDAQIVTVLQSDGRLNLAKLLPPPPPEPAPETDLPTLTIERVRLGEAEITFCDLTRTPETRASLSLHEVTTGAISLQAQGLASPVQIQIKGALDTKTSHGGSIASEGQVLWNRSETRIEATLNVQQFALAIIEPYLREAFVVRQLAGAADGQLRYHLQRGGEQQSAHILSGAVTVTNLSFVDPLSNQSALRVDNGQVVLEGVDFLRRDIRIASIALRDAELALLQTDTGLNWASFFPRQSESTGQNPQPQSEPQGWRYAIRNVQVNGGEVLFRDDSWPEAETVKIVPTQLELQALGSDVQETPMRFQLGVGVGQASGEGNVRFAPFGIDAQMSLSEMWLSPFAPLIIRAVPVKQMDAVLNGDLHAGIEVEDGRLHLRLAGALDAAAMSADGLPTSESSLLWKSARLEVSEGSTILPTLALGIRGQIADIAVNNLPQGNVFVESIDGELRFQRGRPADFSVAQSTNESESAALDVSAHGGVQIKGFVMRQGPDNVEVLSFYQARAELQERSRVFPLDLQFASVALEYPYIQGFRTKAGQLQLDKPLPPENAAPVSTSVVGDTPTTEQHPEPVLAVAPSSPPRIHVEHLTFIGGQFYFEDYAVTPSQTIYWQDINVDLKDGAYPLARPTSFTFHAFNMDGAPIEVRGSTQRQGNQLVTKVDGTIDRLTLSRFNVYLAPQLGYRVRQGAVSVKWSLMMPGDLLRADAAVTVHDLGLGGKASASGLEEQVGLSMSLIVALLKDLNGDINLQLPVEGRLSDPGFHFGGSVWRAIRDVLIGAVTSPLKLLGAVFSKKNKLEDFVLEPIAFFPGTSLPTNAGKEQLQRLKLFLTQRPELDLRLSSSFGPADQQALQDRLILSRMQSTEQTQASLPATDTEQSKEEHKTSPEEEVQQFLTHRVNHVEGKTPVLSEQATKVLTELREKMAVEPQALTQLSQDRIQYVMTSLSESGGVAVDRLHLSPEKLREHEASDVQYMIQAREVQKTK